MTSAGSLLEAAFTDFSNQLGQINNNIGVAGQSFVSHNQRTEQQLNLLTSKVGSQGATNVIPSFDGKTGSFKEWIQAIETFGLSNDIPSTDWKKLAYQTSKGSVNAYLKSTNLG